MGVNASLLVYCDDPPLDVRTPLPSWRDAAGQLLVELYPRTRFVEHGVVSLVSGAFPDDGYINLAAFRNGAVVATRRAMLFNPSKLEARFVKVAGSRTVHLLAQRSMYDMVAYARWEGGTLARSISANPVGKVWESIGAPEPFEARFWEGSQRPAPDYPLPFHPLDLGEAALRHILGACFEGLPEPGLADPSTVELLSFGRANRRGDLDRAPR
jgi:hypothetical protein